MTDFYHFSSIFATTTLKYFSDFISTIFVFEKPLKTLRQLELMECKKLAKWKHFKSGYIETRFFEIYFLFLLLDLDHPHQNFTRTSSFGVIFQMNEIECFSS